MITDYVSVDLPMAALAAVPDRTRCGPAGPALIDFDPIRACYDTWAIAQNGPLSRRGVSFPATAEDFLGSFTGVTVAEDATGARLRIRILEPRPELRRAGDDRVSDLLATTPDGYRALLAVMGSFASITGTCQIDTSSFDLAAAVPANPGLAGVARSPYMIKIIDVPGAISCRATRRASAPNCASGCRATSWPRTTVGTRSRSPEAGRSAFAMIMRMTGC